MHLAIDCTSFHEKLATHEQDDEEARVNACFSDARLTEFRGIVYNNQVETTELGEITSVCITDCDGACGNAKAKPWEFSVYPQVETVTSNGQERNR